MRAFIFFIVNFLIAFTLFLVSSTIQDQVYEPLGTAVNDTLTGNAPLVINSLYNWFRTVLGTYCVITVIGIILAYVFDTHRREGEEFEYYENYR